jgi:hypothetical protein
MRDLLLIVPSRNRPKSIIRLAEAMKETCAGDTQLLVCLDMDDAAHYLPLIEGVWYMVGEPQQLGSWTNRSVRMYGDGFRFLGSIGDDHVPRTPGWDNVVAATLAEMGTGMCFGDDLLQGSDLPTACFMTSDIVRALGFMCPPTLVHMYVDNFWLELGNALGRLRYLPDIVIEHMHFTRGKSSNDAVYSSGESLMDADKAAFATYLAERFDQDVAKVRALTRTAVRDAESVIDSPHRAPARRRRVNLDSVHTPVLIVCRDRVEPLRRLVTWLESAGHERLVFVDNDSTFEPLLSYYQETSHQVIRLGRNLGHLSVWDGNVLQMIGHDGAFVVTDCDVVPDQDAPHDALDHFADLLFRYSDIDKVGFGLRIDDLPPSYQFRTEVIDWESQFWESEVEPGVFRADIDTTFALYRPSAPKGAYRALRTGLPYVARHLPWYSDSLRLSVEDQYYREHALSGVSNWDVEEIPPELQDAIAARRAQKAAASPMSGPADNESPAEPPAIEGLGEKIAELEKEFGIERARCRSLEEELDAIRATRSYRWLKPLRGIRAASLRLRGPK